MIVSVIYALYEIMGNVFVGIGGYFEFDNLPMYIVRNCIPFLHFTLFTIISNAYIYTLIKASISFEMIVSSVKSTDAERKRRRKAFRIIRGASMVILNIGSLAVSIVNVSMCVLFGLRRYNIIPTTIYSPLNNILIPATAIPVLIAYASLLLIFTIMLIVTLKKSNSALKGQKDKRTINNIQDRKLRIIRYVIGLVLYVFHCALVGIFLIWYLSRQTSGSPFEYIIIDIFLRVVPTPVLLTSILVVFWPW